MVLDITYFSYGVGLVMAGFILGLCVKFVFSLVGRL